jgi:hypothetical protein
MVGNSQFHKTSTARPNIRFECQPYSYRLPVKIVKTLFSSPIFLCVCPSLTHPTVAPPLSHGLIGKPRWAVFSIASTCATAAFALRFGAGDFNILIHIAPPQNQIG